jgi:putative transposase
LPATVDLELTVPPCFASADEFRSAVTTELRTLEAKEQARRFLGVARVLAQSPFARPAPGEPRFELNPRIAARDKWRRVEAICRLKSFVADYRRAWAARRSATAGVVFPAGTYLLRVLHGVQCAGAA